ncbi:NnrS family protein [Shimia biformata]|uniref:NnrS family protein n=1 Tax=Shimia biformata TaxID=1294299 RepID=UPI0019518B4C|nr:NnrS family protein [Shimia biformata]
MLAGIRRVFSQGFRVFFLAAGVFGVLTGAIWALWLMGQAGEGSSVASSAAMTPTLWHAHEMVFGYGAAALGGFFLTAVPNWTDTPSARSAFLAVAALAWAAGRLVLWYSGTMPLGAVAAIDLLFVPILGSKIASQLVKRPKPQNVMFLGILALYWAGNLRMHLDWMDLPGGDAGAGLRTGLFALCAMIAILGGRITPAFTRNAMNRAGAPETVWPVSVAKIEKPTVVLALALPLTVLFGLPAPISGAIAVVFGVLQLLRVSKWGWRWALRQPILIALHLGIVMLGLGMLAWGAAALGLGQEIAALHLLGIGCVGGMTLAVMSRASLGHSGRPLVAPKPVALGYVLIPLAAFLRWLGAEAGEGLYYPMMIAASLTWALVFALFLVALWPALTGPRLGAQDG